MTPSLRLRPPTQDQSPPMDTAATRSKRVSVASTTPRSPVIPRSPVKLKRTKSEKVIVIPSRRSSRTVADGLLARDEILTRQREHERQHDSENEDNEASSRSKSLGRRLIRAVVRDHILIITGIPRGKRKFDAILQPERGKDEPSTVNGNDQTNGLDPPETPRKRRKVNWASRTAGQPRRSLRSDPALESVEKQDTASPESKDQREQNEDENELQGKTRAAVNHPEEDPEDANHYPDDVQPTIEHSPAPFPKERRPKTEEFIPDESQLDLQPSLTKTSQATSQSFHDAQISPTTTFKLTTNPPSNRSEAPRSVPTSQLPSPRRSTSPIPATLALQPTPPSPPASPNALPATSLPGPYLPLPSSVPIRNAFPDDAAYLLAKNFPPLVPPSTFIKALTSHPPSARTTATLLALASNTQKALKAWQDEYLRLDKQTAPVAGPFPKKPATGGRTAMDPLKFDDEKERELFGEGSLLARYRIRRPVPSVTTTARAPSAAATTAATHTQTEGRGLRRRRGDVGVTENIGISDDDAGATEGKRTRKPVRRFEIGQNGEGGPGGRGNGRRRRGGGAGTSTPRGSTNVDSLSRWPRSADDVPSKRGRLSVLQNSGDAITDTDTNGSPAPGDDELSDGDYAAPLSRNTNNTHNPITTTSNTATHAPRRRPNPTTATNSHPRTKTAPSSAAATPGGDGGTLGTAAQAARKPRQKSEKRSESMTAWWAERKRKAAEQKRLQAEAEARSRANAAAANTAAAAATTSTITPGVPGVLVGQVPRGPSAAKIVASRTTATGETLPRAGPAVEKHVVWPLNRAAEGRVGSGLAPAVAPGSVPTAFHGGGGGGGSAGRVGGGGGGGGVGGGGDIPSYAPVSGMPHYRGGGLPPPPPSGAPHGPGGRA